MDLVNAARIVRRRWYAVLAGVVLTLVGAGVVWSLPPTYEATSVLVLLAPNTPPPVEPGSGLEPEPVNPYQAFDSSIVVTADLMSTRVTQPEVVDALVRRGASPDYTVGRNLDSASPIVTITARAKTPDQATGTARLVTTEFRTQLLEQQTAAGAPERALITTSSVVTPTRADELVSGRVRALVAVIGVGTVLSICLGLLAEAIATSRQRRHDHREPVEPVIDRESARDRLTVATPEPTGRR